MASFRYYSTAVLAIVAWMSVSVVVTSPPPPWVTLENNNHTNDITRATVQNSQETTVQYVDSENITERSMNSIMATQSAYPTVANLTTAGQNGTSRESKEVSSSSDRNSEILTTAVPATTTTTPPVQINPEEMRKRALKGFMQIFDMTSEDLARSKSPGPAPEFMIDLYNTVTDSFGVTRAKNPYNAHIVRSFMERGSGNSRNDYFYFNVSGLEDTETVLEAELHVHRSPTPHDQLHPSLYLTPFYILSLYAVVDTNNLEIPDLHQLLGVHYVPALGSGWEVFNVKQSVLKWINNGHANNHGFLVAATSLGGDRVPVKFARRGEKVDNKQPILVLFTEDSKLKEEAPEPVMMMVKQAPKMAKPEKSGNGTGSETNSEETQQQQHIPLSSLENPRFHHTLLYKDSIRHPNSVNRFRSRRSKNQTEGVLSDDEAGNMTTCGKQNLYVSFEAIGWSSWIISPKGYNAFHCAGPCSFPLGQEVKPSNHATVQSIVHELNLTPGIGRPCCVPTMLLPISLLYYDNHDNVVLKQYPDMVADSCGCL